MDAAERTMLVETVRGALAAVQRPRLADDVLGELGWLELLAAEPEVALDVVFAALGETGASATVLDDVLAAALGVAPRADLAVLLPRFATWEPPGATTGGRPAASGLATARAGTAAELLVVLGAEAELLIGRVPASRAEIGVVQGIDPDAGFRTVRVQDERLDTARLDGDAWQAAVACGRRAVAHQIAGACRAMLALATAHAKERVQFGRVIARFQAVRHRLAEALVAIEALEATLAVAGEERSALTAALAKAAAGRAARTVGAHCQQVLAGIGFTTEHAFHRFLKRTMLLEGLFGRADDVVLEVGRGLLAERRVPSLVQL